MFCYTPFGEMQRSLFRQINMIINLIRPPNLIVFEGKSAAWTYCCYHMYIKAVGIKLCLCLILYHTKRGGRLTKHIIRLATTGEVFLHATLREIHSNKFLSETTYPVET